MNETLFTGDIIARGYLPIFQKDVLLLVATD